MSIDATNNYETLLVGFSWDSDTEVSPVGWRIAKIIANGNGPLLAKFISDYKHHCPDDKIRVASHSLGARVVLSALQTLAENTTTNKNDSDWSRNGFKIISVHLMGAAVDDEQVSMDSKILAMKIDHLYPALEAL